MSSTETSLLIASLAGIIALITFGFTSSSSDSRDSFSPASFSPDSKNYAQASPSGKKYFVMKNDKNNKNTNGIGRNIDLESLGLDPSIPTIIFAKASWCGHCVRATPTIQGLQKELNINIIEVDETNKKSQENLGVKAFPTFFIVKNGTVTDFKKGFSPDVEKAIRALSS